MIMNLNVHHPQMRGIWLILFYIIILMSTPTAKNSLRTTNLTYSFYQNLHPTSKLPNTDRSTPLKSLSLTPPHSHRSRYCHSERPSKWPQITYKTSNPGESLKLGIKLTTHRQNLLKKLQMFKLVHQIENINKCVKHNSYLSVYDQNSSTLLCAVCYSQYNHHGTHNDHYVNHQPDEEPNCDIAQSKKNRKYRIIPIQKSRKYLESDISEMKRELESEILTMKEIQNILVQGFNNELKSLENSLSIIDEKYEQVISKLKENKEKLKQQLTKQYSNQKLKHQIVIKEVAYLRTIVEDYIAEAENKLVLSCQLPKSSNTHSNSNSKNNKHIVVSLTHKKYLNEQCYKGQAKSIDNEIIRHLVYKHIIYKQLMASVKFNKNGDHWHKTRHHNHIKQTADPIIAHINSILSRVQME